MKKILVPTDFSACADNATEFALRLSAIIPAEIVLVHSVDALGPVYTDYMGANKEFHEKEIRDAQQSLEERMRSIREKQDVRVSVHLYEGSVKETVLKAISEHEIDLVIMGTLGNSGLKERILGSKTASLISKTPIPLIVVPHEYKWKQPARLLFLTNHFETEPRVLDLVFELAGMFMSEVNVAMVTDETFTDTVIRAERNRKLEGYETLLRDRYQDETLVAKQLVGDRMEDSLQRYADEHEIDMFVMVTYHRNFFERFLEPSTTRKMSYHTRIPLLVIPVAPEEEF